MMLYLSGCISAPLIPHLDRHELGVMRTPNMGNRVPPSWTWAADNGCFNPRTYWGDSRWIGWLSQQDRTRCLFATAPDIVGDASATLRRSAPWLPIIRSMGYPAAYVAQDGATPRNVPWADLDYLFIGGSTLYKLTGARSVIEEAHTRAIPVHVGRVNSRKRWRYCHDVGAASADGTYLAFGPQRNLPTLLTWITETNTQGELF